MTADLNDIHARLAVAETEIKTAKQAIGDLEHNFASISRDLFEVRETSLKQTSVAPMITEKIEKISDFMLYNFAKSDTSRDKILAKVESLEEGFNQRTTVEAINNMKVKIMWGVIVFLLSTAGVLLTEVIKSKIP